MKRLLVTVAAAGFGLGGCGGAALATAPPRSVPLDRAVAIYDCSGHAVTRPASLVLACGDANSQLRGMRWTGWGHARASGSGVLSEASCNPSCATGGLVNKRVHVTASGLTLQGTSALYSQMTVGKQRYALSRQGPSQQ
ncbi:MAG: hypothetical protein J2O48_14005 [Solirubrobacterales bacterium]|nr:hypothetical protein [Solirubrobacterales bacterium]